MALLLNLGTMPENLEARSHEAGSITVGDAEISSADFAELVKYWLTNTDLAGPNDARLQLIAEIKTCKTVPGYNLAQRRISL